MRNLACLSAMPVCLAFAASAVGQVHSGDITLSVPTAGGPIATSGGEWVGDYAGRVFDEGIMPSSPPFVTSSPGFDSSTGTFPAGALIRYDFVQQLLYWDGTALTPPTATMMVDYQDVRFATITGSDTAGSPGFVITSVPSNGSFHEHLDYALPSDAAAGLYGLVLTLGPGGATPAFTTSDSFLVTFAQGSFSDYATGLQAMVNAAFDSADILINVPSGTQTQGQAGHASIPSATSVTKTGAGTLVFDAVNTYTGITMISAGTLEVSNPDGLAATNVTVDTGATLAIALGTTMKSPAVIVDGGTLSTAALTVSGLSGIASLAINAGTITGAPVTNVGAGGALALAQDARVTVAVGSLTVMETPGGGRVDLGAGEIIVAAGGISAADLRADIIAGRNGGAWTGTTGITSSTAAASGGTGAVGYLVNGDGSARVSFAVAGDVDLSGSVNVFDVVSINSSGKYGTGLASAWSQGDFNYDGVTNVFDLVAVNTAGTYGQGNYFPAAPTAVGGVAAVSVPEPAGLGAGIGTACLIGLLRWPGRRMPQGRQATSAT